MRALAVDHQCRRLDDEVDEHEVAHCRLAHFPVVHGEGPENFAASREYGDRPAGTKSVGKGDVLVIGPERIVRDIRNIYGAADECGRPAGSCARTDLDALDRLAVSARKAGRGPMMKMLALSIEEQDRAEHAGRG